MVKNEGNTGEKLKGLWRQPVRAVVTLILSILCFLIILWAVIALTRVVMV